MIPIEFGLYIQISVLMKDVTDNKRRLTLLLNDKQRQRQHYLVILHSDETSTWHHVTGRNFLPVIENDTSK